jgi:hypothetical protein
MDRIQMDINDVYQSKDDNDKVKDKIITLFRLYVQEDVLEKQKDVYEKKGDSTNVDEGPQRQYNRDREQMERNMNSLRRALETDNKMHKKDLAKMMREQVLLTSQLNELREEYHVLNMQINGLDQIIANGPKENVIELVGSLGLALAGKPPPSSPRPDSIQSNSHNLDLVATRGNISPRAPSTGLSPRAGSNGLSPRAGSNGFSPRAGSNGFSPRAGSNGLSPRAPPEGVSAQARSSARSNAIKKSASIKSSLEDSNSTLLLNDVQQELENQNENIEQLSNQILAICETLGLNSDEELAKIDLATDIKQTSIIST